MLRRFTLASLVVAAIVVSLFNPTETRAAGRGQPTDWKRFFYYPYLYYPHNFKKNTGSYDHMYYRYSPRQRIPVYDKNWYNFYPTARPYHKGNHFVLDVF